MNVVAKEVSALIQKEYEAAKENNGPFSSFHEGYAILLEEIEETKEACEQIEVYRELLWRNIRHDDRPLAEYNVQTIADIAAETACEAIQVAAVCRRIMDCCEGEKHGEA